MLTPETPSYSGSSSTPRAPTSSRATRSTGRTGRSTKTRGCGEPSSWTPEGTERLRSSPARTRRDELGEPRAGLMRCPRGSVRKQDVRDEGDHAPQEDKRRDQQERREAEQPRECGRGSDASHERDRRHRGEEQSGHGSARTGGAHDREPEERTGECARGPLAPGDDLDRQGDHEPGEQRQDHCGGEGIRPELDAEARGRGPRDARTIADRALDDDEHRLQGTGRVHDKNPLQEAVYACVRKTAGQPHPSKSPTSRADDFKVRKKERDGTRPKGV